jgi:hypothetical protein
MFIVLNINILKTGCMLQDGSYSGAEIVALKNPNICVIHCLEILFSIVDL